MLTRPGPADAGIRAIAMPRFDPAIRRDAIVAPDQTLAQIVELLVPEAKSPTLKARLRVTIDGHVILPGALRRVRPKAGATVVIRVVPGKDAVLRNVLLLAATVAAAAVGQLWVGPALAGAAGLAAGSAGAAAITSGTSALFALGATLLFNALIPIRAKKRTDSETYSVMGWQNSANPDGLLPQVLGRHKVYPVYFQPPWTEAIGDDVYVRAGFLVGYGPLKLRSPQIGRTPIDRYVTSSVEYEIMEGYPGDPKSKICREQVIQENHNIRLEYGIAEKRYTPRDCTRFSVDISFPTGFGGLKKSNGNALAVYASFSLSVRNILTGVTTILPALSYTDSRATKPRVFTSWHDLPERGKYEITIARTTPDEPDDQSAASIQMTTRSYLTAIRGVRPEYPINFGKPVAIAAVKIKATAQANGTLDSFSLDASSIVPDWDEGEGAWIPRESANPAALFRHILTGPSVTYPLTAEKTEALEEWWRFCDAKGLRYNRIHAEKATVGERLSDIAAAGRATPQDRGTRWGVVIDRIQTEIVAHLSARNSANFATERQYQRYPDGFRVSFPDEENDFEPVERIIPWIGFVGTPTVVEDLPLPGFTNAALVWIEARRRMREIMLRPDTHTVEQDILQLACSRGHRVLVSHFVLRQTMVASRVKAVSGKVVVLEDLVTMAAGESYACRFEGIVPNPNPTAPAEVVSTLRLVETVPGETRTIVLSDEGRVPEIGEPAMFGLVGEETEDCIVRSKEGMEDLAARLTLVPHAPEIETLTDAEVPPPWNGRSGGEVVFPPETPLAPRIVSVLSGQSTAPLATEAMPDPVSVALAPGTGEPVSIGSFLVSHRPAGGAWSAEIETAGGALTVVFGGYAKGAGIEVRARAKSRAGVTGPYAAAVPHVIGQDDPVRPSVDRLSAEKVGSFWSFAWDIDLPDDEVSVAGVMIRYAPGLATDWAAMTPLNTGIITASPWTSHEPSADGFFTFAAMAVDADGPVEPPRFTWSTSPAGPALLVDDEGGLILDSANDAILEGP